MKKIAILPFLLFFGWSLQAQVSTDTIHSRNYSPRARHWRNQSGWGSDSGQRRNRNDFGQERPQAMNRFPGYSGERRLHLMGGRGNGVQAFRIHFTPEQRKQSEAINREYRQKSADLYKNDNLTLREYKSRLIVLQKEKKSRLKAVLTDEQKDQMTSWRKQASENAQVRDAALLERMRIRLELNDSQIASIKSQRTVLRTQMHSIRENEDLLPDQKMDQIRALAGKQKEMMKSVLTPEQYSTFENMHTQRLGGK
jgi:hypothetical protein